MKTFSNDSDETKLIEKLKRCETMKFKLLVQYRISAKSQHLSNLQILNLVLFNTGKDQRQSEMRKR